MVNGTPVSTGTFTVDANGDLSDNEFFDLMQQCWHLQLSSYLTVEPNPDGDPLPSDQKLIAGDFTGNSASVSTGVAPAIGDFSASTGSFFLRSPTDEQMG